HLQPDPALLTRLALLGHPRGLPSRGCKARVTESALAAARHPNNLTGVDEVRQYPPCLVVHHHRARWDVDVEVGTALTGLLGSLARLAALGAEVLLVLEGDQRVEVRVHAEVDIAAVPAIAAVRPAEGHVLLSPETDRPVAAIAGFDVDLRPRSEERR